MKIKLRTLTPIWTGDIDSKSNLLQSTGILGSLRWWIEIILRGVDKFACDPIGDNRCPINIRKDNQEISQYCPACLIFGATGMRRIFRLYMSGGEKIFDGSTINIKPKNRNRGWYLGSGLTGMINLDIIPLDNIFKENLILTPLIIASKWGGLGAKTQHGYDVVEFENYPEINIDDFKESLESVLKKERLEALKIEQRIGNDNSVPNIKEMFFAKVQFDAVNNNWWTEVDGIRQALNPIDRRGRLDEEKQIQNTRILTEWFNSGSVPITPAIKNWLKFGAEKTTTNGKKLQVSPYKEVSNKEISQWLLGSSDETNKTASKITISCAYPIKDNLWEFRIWGWIPKNNLPNGFGRDNFLNALKTSLNGSGSINIQWNNLLGSKTKEHKLTVWREFNSSRDTVSPNQKDMEKYLDGLIKG